MDELAALIIEKLREGDGPREGIVALASYWDSDSRRNLLVQPVTKNGMRSYNILTSVWRSDRVHVAYGGWVRMTDAHIASLPALEATCNFETLEGVARFLVATVKTGRWTSPKAGVDSIAVGRRGNGLYRIWGAKCETTDDVMVWLRLMDEMRLPIA